SIAMGKPFDSYRNILPQLSKGKLFERLISIHHYIFFYTSHRKFTTPWYSAPFFVKILSEGQINKRKTTISINKLTIFAV
ncbi:hypothetical protein, partial [uncultured Parabacteroides sp.]|uniref:hypothetical protein n=1 Tax=uncultured Parabacteroides sp. TaxID=512312 RepID=UPI00258B826B